MNVVFASTSEHLKLPIEPHPQPYKALADLKRKFAELRKETWLW